MTSISMPTRETELSDLLNTLGDLVQARGITKKEPGQPDFVLASGRRSGYYCDTKKVTLSPEGSKLTGEILFRLLKDTDAEAVGGLQLGATFIATAVALVSWQNHVPIYGFTVRELQKKHGTKEKVAESFHPDGRQLLCAGRKVAVVDDVVTEGGSILKAIEEVQDRGCKLVAVVSIVDRGEGGGQKLKALELPYYPLLFANEPGVLTINADLISSTRVH